MKKAKKTRKQPRARKSRKKTGLVRSSGMQGDTARRMFDEVVRCLQMGNAAKAESLCRKIIKAEPAHYDALHLLGVACRDQGRPEEGVLHLERSVALNPSFADTHNNLGVAFAALGRHEEAIDAFRKAIEIEPDYAMAHDNLGLSQKDLGQAEEAIASFRRALQIDPNRSGALSTIAEISRQNCDWTSHADLRRSMITRAEKASSGINPFWLLSFSDDPALLLQCARRYASDEIGKPVTVKPRASRNDNRIYVAYLSADFREHPVAHQIAPVIEGHDRNRFEITGISFGADDESPMRQRLVQSFDRFLDVRECSDREIAQLIAEEKTHIAVDLMGYTADLRPGILAGRPAPIQVNYLGFPGTMGAEHMDYIVVDDFVAPVGCEAHFSEQPVRLPDCYMVSDRPLETIDRQLSRSEAGLPDEGIVFCAFNNAYKISPGIFDVWMRILTLVPNSVLWLRSDNELAQANLRREAEQRSVGPERLISAPRVEFAVHLARQRLADLFLDTLPYNAHSTACDALWAGLPVLTCAGNSFAGRVAGSLLHAVDLPELVAATLEEYERLAVQLARDPQTLAGLRDKLARQRNMSALFDAPLFVRNLELAYGAMFEGWAGGKPTRPIAVSPKSS